MSVALTGCVGDVRDRSEPVVYMYDGYYYGSYYDGGYYRYYDRRGYDSRFYYAPAPAPAIINTTIAPSAGVIVSPGRSKRKK